MLIAICIVAALVFSLSYYHFRRINLNNIAKSRRDVLLQISDVIGQIQTSANILSNLYYFNDNIDTIIETNPLYLDQATIYDHNIRMKTMNQLYSAAMANFDIDYYFILIANNGYNYISVPKQADYDFSKYDTEFWNSRLDGTMGKMIIVSPYLDRISGKIAGQSLFARIVKDAIARPAGKLIINVRERTLFKEYENVTKNGLVYIVNADGVIVSATDTTMIGTQYPYPELLDPIDDTAYERTIDGTDAIITTCAVGDTGLRIIEQIAVSEITEPLRVMLREMLLWTGSICLLASLLCWWAVEHTIRPLNDLCAQLMLVSGGNFDVDFSIHGWRELQYINSACLVMQREIKTLFENFKREEEFKKLAEIRALQAQINPHFMYNTLFSIKCMVDMQENEKASAMLKLYSNMLRRMFRSPIEFTTVKDELVTLENYIDIMRYRYPQKFEYHFDVPEEIRNCKILRFVLQPIIENAVFHGIVPAKGAGRIDIRMWHAKEEDLLFIEVADSGIGILPEQIEKALYQDPGGDHIGLFNVRERLRLYFDDSDALRIQSTPGKGTVILIRHPIIY
jgi:two-component system sensor histidine kinase YesM